MIRINSFCLCLFYLIVTLSIFTAHFEDLSIFIICGATAFFSLLSLATYPIKREANGGINLILFLVVLWFLNVSLSILFHLVPTTAQYGLFQCASWFFSFIIIASNNNFEKSWCQFKKLICFLGLICSTWAIIQNYGFNEMAAGPFGTRNSNGAFLMVTALVICSEILNDTVSIKEKITNTSKLSYSKTITHILLFFIVNVALLLSFSRGIYICYGLSLLFLFTVNFNRTSVKNIFLLCAVILLDNVLIF